VVLLCTVIWSVLSSTESIGVNGVDITVGMPLLPSRWLFVSDGCCGLLRSLLPDNVCRRVEKLNRRPFDTELSSESSFQLRVGLREGVTNSSFDGVLCPLKNIDRVCLPAFPTFKSNECNYFKNWMLNNNFTRYLLDSCTIDSGCNFFVVSISSSANSCFKFSLVEIDAVNFIHRLFHWIQHFSVHSSLPLSKWSRQRDLEERVTFSSSISFLEWWNLMQQCLQR